jgi:hypothetical protein
MLRLSLEISISMVEINSLKLSRFSQLSRPTLLNMSRSSVWIETMLKIETLASTLVLTSLPDSPNSFALVLSEFREIGASGHCISKLLSLGVSICLDVVSIETLDLDTEKKSVST